MTTTFRSVLRTLLAVFAVAGTAVASAQWAPPATRPDTGKVERVESLRLAPGLAKAVTVALGAADQSAIDAVRRANASPMNKRLQIGIGRPALAQPSTQSSALKWQTVTDGAAAHWQVSSTGARALRVGIDVASLPSGTEIRFAGAAGQGTVYGPFTAADVAAGGDTWWSPVLEGDAAIVEVYQPAGNAAMPELSIAQVSHLFAAPTDVNIDSLAKIGESESCEVDLICRSASDPELARVGKAVARMTFTASTGGTALCTGTLLTTTDTSFTAYFYSAAHCFSTQSEASSLTTHWFYDRTGCGTGGVSGSYVQVPGGATLLYANTTTDVLFLKLNQSPPQAAVYAGWDASTLSVGTALTAVHHPAGDVKKVSLGRFAGFSGYNGASGSTHLDVTWNGTATGVTEGGSSGSGVFSLTGGNYLLRGGLHGGPSSCSASGSNLRDYYSRFDQAYPSLAQWLNPSSGGGGGGTTTSLVTNGGFESGSTGWSQQTAASSSIIVSNSALARTGSGVAFLGGYNNGLDVLSQNIAIPADATQVSVQYWYRIGTNETVAQPYDILSVRLQNASGVDLATIASYSNVNAASAWTQSPAFDLSAYRGQTIRLVFRVTTDEDLTTAFYVDDVTLIATTSGEGTTANYTGLYYNAPAESEAGWGVNFTHQGDKMFATLFTYDASNQPLWLVMSGGSRQADGVTFTGALFRTTGPAFDANPFVWNPATSVATVGSLTVTFTGSETALLTYTFNGVSVSKSIVKQRYGTRVATCVSTTPPSRAGLTNYQDLWYKSPAESEPGWGINLTHQDNTIFATLFTYDRSGRDLWLVMSGGVRQADGSYAGILYRTTGPVFNANPFNPLAVNAQPVGTMSLRFTDGVSGTLTYTYLGSTVVKPITRQVFSSPVPACS
jgi:hypothetical protein